MMCPIAVGEAEPEACGRGRSGPSIQLGGPETGVQNPLSQLAVLQSLAAPQCRLTAQALHSAPPQSTSLSLPFVTTSVQVGAAHALLRHTPLWQLAARPAHTRPVPHAEQVPPQSMSLSAPLRTASVHCAATQSPTEHTPLWQLFPAAPQALPLAQAGHAPPPQSTSVSPPFFTPSLQLGA